MAIDPSGFKEFMSMVEEERRKKEVEIG